jgi:hypothetical protein
VTPCDSFEVTLNVGTLTHSFAPQVQYTLGSVIVPVVPRNVFHDPCYLGAALRRLELLFGDSISIDNFNS